MTRFILNNGVNIIKNSGDFVGLPEGRRAAIIKGSWENGFADILIREKVDLLYLNYSLGWEGEDLSFLGELPNLRCIKIIAGKVRGLRNIENLTDLQYLSISATCREEMDFTKLHSLQYCFLEWWMGAASILDCADLDYLYLNSLKGIELNRLESLKKVRTLTIGNSTIDNLSWIKSLPSLEKLELINCPRIKDFDSLASSKRLTWLALNGCKGLLTIDFVVELERLEIFVFSDCGEISTIAPLASVRSLKAVSFSGSTVIKDGDLSPLLSLPKLAMLSFTRRRHYSHKLIKRWNWENFDKPDIQLCER
ncbi:leucine-rich repeat domain-containing protein [Pseudidiomarina salilacus]|uniref:hypothetical protein n=1 Tax=Pseudidiomarina salilacus TaxID=3384452 RepID=UPI0039846E30